ncbi:MAG: tRNA uridine(34) 5-carboxymethylaminomethyl modification radical SAM/GNAT enzyme Elp3 [Candidatus Methanomethyliaceae archaeon]|nr:tRNA uridine(34) 5-carboxymethylaminomethyl modification radical SAM/GNAT enzyme Elp3 [Candidatus Methanomethyliaceae archaeon]
MTSTFVNQSKEERAARRIIEILIRRMPDRRELNKIKHKISEEEGLEKVLKDHEILRYLKDEEMQKGILDLLVGKRVRSASGIYTVAVMTKPSRCPKDRPCSYCPGGVDYGTPQSYFGKEPALMRGIQSNFDPYRQVMYRLTQYSMIGHRPSKIQLIIMGGTFPATDLDYQEWFVMRCLEAMNDYPEFRPYRWRSLEEAQARNEKSKVRCIGITMETRPDWAKEHHTDRMVRLGATLVEVGVQALDDELLRRVNRGSTVKDVKEATRILRDSGLKVGYHMMPGLPGSTMERDLEDLRRIFYEEDFRPDYLKVYPTLVIEGTDLYADWLAGRYQALGNEEAADLLVEAHKHFPKWVRVARIQRDVPAHVIKDGVTKSNLREIVDARLKMLGIRCRCIRCREVGLARIRGEDVSDLRPEIKIEEYLAGGGTELFISLEDRDFLVGFLRLRIPSERAHRPEVIGAGIIRELHIYGPQIPVGERDRDAYQHRGLGTILLKKAEEIVGEKFGLKKIVVLPGIGVRGYYRKRGYRRLPSSPYMVKRLS